MCDAGRYSYRSIDENRVQVPQIKDDIVSWESAMDAIAQAIKLVQESGKTDRIGVIASAQLTNEDLFAVRKLFKDTLKISQVDYRVPEKAGDSDDFLIKADKNPNTAGARAILQGQEGLGVEQIIQKAKQGEIDLLYVFGHDLVKLFGRDTVEQIAKKTKLFVWQGSNINETCGYAHVILPSAVYAEKDGTFTNVQQRVQRIWQSVQPMAEAKGDWEIVSLLAGKLDVQFNYRDSESIFNEITKSVGSFSQMTYESIGDQGSILKS
jgi:predicted molibdopterin-dependent oxidoreductase YjgC